MNVLLPRPSFNALATSVTHGRWPLGRHAAIASVVLALHASLIWVLQSGSALHPPEVVVPVEVLAELMTPPAPSTTPAPPTRQPAPTPPLPSAKPVMPSPPAKAAPKTSVQPQVQPQPLAIADPTPAPHAPAGSLAPSPPSPSSTATPSPAQTPPAPPAAGPAAPPAPPAAAVQLPSSDADYLQNPKPTYPPLSKRLGEQGKVIVRVLIGADGQPQKAEPKQSSGFDRLDQAALATVMKWRYVPGKRGGVAEDMWFNVPINFVLE